MDTTPNAPVYPIPRPHTGDDARFTIGLAIDVAAVIAAQGYPQITTGHDLVRLQQALFTMIYQEKNTS